jgi:hypothetical protein
MQTRSDTKVRGRRVLYVIEECGDDPAFEQPAAFLHALHDALVIQETVP